MRKREKKAALPSQPTTFQACHSIPRNFPFAQIQSLTETSETSQVDSIAAPAEAVRSPACTSVPAAQSSGTKTRIDKRNAVEKGTRIPAGDYGGSLSPNKLLCGASLSGAVSGRSVARKIRNQTTS